MAEQVETVDKSCAVCGRRLLTGERPSAYFSREGLEVAVCELCKGRAESVGWLRPEQARAPRESEGGRRRRRRGGELLGGLLGRVERGEPLRRRGGGGATGAAAQEKEASGRPSDRAEQVDPEPDAERPREEKDEATQTPPASREKSPREARSAAGPDINQAIAAFNASENRRTIAGLSRSLGEPQATVIAVRTASGHTGARLTVAWELAWYQWEIGPGKRGPEIRQMGKGETIEQLRAADRNWNLTMAEDGALGRPKPQE